MSDYCVNCGGSLRRARYCPDCGHPAGIAAEQPTVAFDAPFPAGGTAPAPVSPPTAGPGRRPRRIAAVAGAAVLAVSVAGLSALAITSQPSSAETDTAAAEQAQRKEIRAEAKRLADKKADKIAERRLAAEREAAAAQQPTVAQAPAAPAPQPPAHSGAGSATGTWSGTMADGHYSFTMDLQQDGTTLYGTMQQYDNTDGESGIQDVTGYREGDVLYLRGSNVRSGAEGWVPDNFAFTLSPDGDTITGTYRCEGCSSNQSASGQRIG